MADITDLPIDKSTWGDGPWLQEPDRAEWEHAGLPCLVAANSYFVDQYRTLDYVRAETNRLAEQLAELAQPRKHEQ